METQRTLALLRRLPQWGTVLLATSLLILGASIAKDGGIASHQSHAAASPVQAILPVASHQDIRADHQILLSSTLRALPEQCRASLRNLYVRYDRPQQRGLAGKGTIILSGNVRNAELRALFIHEFGHITDLGCLRGSPQSGQSTFRDGPETIFRDDPSTGFYGISWLQETARKPDSAPEDFVSGYAAKDAFEDFAETFAYFVLQPEAFRARAEGNGAIRQKWEWMTENVFKNHAPLAFGRPWDGSLPWDVTKLQYTVVYSPHASAAYPRRSVASR